MVTRHAVVVGIATLTGCAGSSPTDTPDEESPRETGGGATGSPIGTDALDLREANVMAVGHEGTPGGDVRFEVTLYHDDDGEDGYANWWQVESLSGDRLGRRNLAHPHGTREFTRSGTVAVPNDVDCVVVRGHDRTHGYGGQAALHDLGTGATHTVRQGPEPSSVSRGDCP